MAHVTQINGTDNVYLSADWTDTLGSGGLDGYSPLDRWRSLTLRGNVMPAGDFDGLAALSGQYASVACPPHDDRNADYVTYYSAFLVSVSGRHEGPNVVDITAEMMVRV
jgi:hypothetical protein